MYVQSASENKVRQGTEYWGPESLPKLHYRIALHILSYWQNNTAARTKQF